MLELLNCRDVDELIETIFNKSYDTRDDNSYSIKLMVYDDEEFDKLHYFYRLPYVAEQKAKKIIIGDNVSSDYENRLQESRYILFEVLDQVFNGDENDKLEEELRICSIEDLQDIISSDSLSKRLCNYILQYTEVSLRKYSQQKSNPDYYYYNSEYLSVNYEYVDADNYSSLDKIEYCEELEKNTGDMTKYIWGKYFKYLTTKQKIFVKNYLLYETCSDGAMRNHNNEVLYSKQSVNAYKNGIRKLIEKKIEDDRYIDIINGRWVYRR